MKQSLEQQQIEMQARWKNRQEPATLTDAAATNFRCAGCKKIHNVNIFRKWKNPTVSAWDIIHLHEWQRGKCPICRQALCLKERSTWVPDHDHTCCPKGQLCHQCLRGVLCGLCNSMLGMADDLTCVLRRGATYLETWRKRKILVKAPLRPINRISDDELITAYQTSGINRIAAELACSPQTIRKRLVKAGAVIRKAGTRP